MAQQLETNIPAGTKVNAQPRPKVDKDLVKQKIMEKDKLIHDKKTVNK